jgi:hypothetical protein
MSAGALTHLSCLSHIRRSSQRFIEVGQETPMSGCVASYPAYTARSLAAHVGAGLNRIATILRTREVPDLVSPVDIDDDSILDFVADALAAFVDIAERTDPEEEIRHFLASAPQTAGFLSRVAVTELAIHTWDLESVNGRHEPIPADLAVELIDSVFDVWAPARLGHDAPVVLDGAVGLIASDAREQWLVETRDGLLSGRRVERARHSVARLSGSASDLLLVLWKRIDVTAAGLEQSGDVAVVQQLVELGYVPDPKTSPAR